MLFKPESIQTCLVDDVAEGGTLVLECALPDWAYPVAVLSCYPEIPIGLLPLRVGN